MARNFRLNTRKDIQCDIDQSTRSRSSDLEGVEDLSDVVQLRFHLLKEENATDVVHSSLRLRWATTEDKSFGVIWPAE